MLGTFIEKDSAYDRLYQLKVLSVKLGGVMCQNSDSNRHLSIWKLIISQGI